MLQRSMSHRATIRGTPLWGGAQRVAYGCNAVSMIWLKLVENTAIPAPCHAGWIVRDKGHLRRPERAVILNGTALEANSIPMSPAGRKPAQRDLAPRFLAGQVCGTAALRLLQQPQAGLTSGLGGGR